MMPEIMVPELVEAVVAAGHLASILRIDTAP
jgi:hypothetical protein